MTITILGLFKKDYTNCYLRKAKALKIAVYPGSFDPVTRGHIDILERSGKLFDRIVVAVVHNVSKCAVFSLEERVEMLKSCTRHLDNIEVEGFSGMLVDFMQKKGSNIVIRGVRSYNDFEYESCMAIMNRVLDPAMETLFMRSDREYVHVSSSAVKEIARLGGDVSTLVTPPVETCLRAKFKN